MDARKGNIYEILNGNKQFLIPVYQRYYSWDLEQCRRLWDDIVEMHWTLQIKSIFCTFSPFFKKFQFHFNVTIVQSQQI